MAKRRSRSIISLARSSLSPLFVFLVLVLLIAPAYAPDDEPDIDIAYLPQQLSDHLNIPLVASEMFLCVCALLSVMLPLAILKAKGLMILSVMFLTLILLIAVSWLPVWSLLLLTLIVALFYGEKIKRMM